MVRIDLMIIDNVKNMKEKHESYKPIKDVKFYRKGDMCSGRNMSCEAQCIYIKAFDVFICGKDLAEKLKEK